MKFGLWYDLRNPSQSGRRTADVYRDTLAQIELAETLGYDDIWLSEHHFVDDGYLPSLLPMAAAVAARTRRVSIGTNVLLMPFHHPIRLAEDCAVVDNLSDGRFIFGPAVGYRLEEFATFGVPRRHRGSLTEEAIEVMQRCWTEEEFDYEGHHFSFRGVRCTPKPARMPSGHESPPPGDGSSVPGNPPGIGSGCASMRSISFATTRTGSLRQVSRCSATRRGMCRTWNPAASIVSAPPRKSSRCSVPSTPPRRSSGTSSGPSGPGLRWSRQRPACACSPRRSYPSCGTCSAANDDPQRVARIR